MEAIKAGRMLEESLEHDDMHFESQWQKVENFLENESFMAERDVQVSEAQIIVFVEEVWLVAKSMRRGRGLAAVRKALLLLDVPPQSVVLLQPDSTDISRSNPFETDEEMTRHWAKLGFGAWSDSDPAWLCLSMEDKLHGLAAWHDQVLSTDGRS